MIRINRASLVNRRSLSSQEYELAKKNLRSVERMCHATECEERDRAAVERVEVTREWYLLELG